MRGMKTIALGALAVLATALGSTAPRAQTTLAALPAPATLAAPVGAARPIAAWVAFCERYAAECAIDANEPARIALTPAAWTTIATVNRRINAQIRPVTDLDHWGTPDRWDLAEDGSGDCEDFQLLKRKLLAEAGLPRRAMRMTVVIDEKGDDFVLDNKTSAVLPWHRTGYVFIKREGTEAVAWVSLGGVTSPTTTANR
ncbi:transglutaminase-like cysteine peptidase [Methylobacterium sp. Leaf112]|uniref:transglutaminase-like cysteine peptidase n=1 Tax=Methylobacterium sp. Leaf112 TaxID=1736258 RepID=UPI0006FB6926|nr:transglutaminase [Methylobacterium sp. Leaf112]